jgi:ParB-like chromosome segregation protein Spo0J
LVSLSEIGQQLPVVVIEEAPSFILIDGFKRVRALKRLARDTMRATSWQVAEAEALLLASTSGFVAFVIARST